MKEETFKLTPSQEVLKSKMAKFLDGPERMFLLIGKPGVGKTTMTKICLSEHINADVETNAKGSNMMVAGITLSHKAKNVLGEHIPNVFTFAKAYGLKEVFNEMGARTFQYEKNDERIPIGRLNIPVFVHDEVSQYTNEMMGIVFNDTPMFSKIILMGDKAQLPPIDANNEMGIDEDSPIFDIDIPESCKHELTERVRQTENNPILNLSDLIREEIFGKQNVSRIIQAINKPIEDDGFGYNYMSYSNLYEHYKTQDVYKSCVVAFRNKTVDYFNLHIRNYLLNNPIETIVENDIICMKDNFYYRPHGVEVLYVLHNADTFGIDRVHIRNFKYSANKKTYKIETYVGSIHGERSKNIIYPTPDGMNVLNTALEEISALCRSNKLKWYVFWDLKKMFCNLTYGYALTAYKVQGSTYDTVYVDINDILMTKPLTPKRKLQTIYTAITRARENVYFLKSKL